MAQTDHDITVLAEARVEFEAQIMAESLRERGIAAHVASADFTTMYGLGRWHVLVRRADLAAAREALVEARIESGVGEGTLAACPGCDYDLSGLPEAAVCPECGLELGPYRVREQQRGIVGAEPSLPEGMARRAAPGALAIVGVLLAGFLLSQGWAEPSYIALGAPVALVGLVVGVIVARRRKRAAGKSGDRA